MVVVSRWYLSWLLFAALILYGDAALSDGEEKKIEDKLDQSAWAQCPIPGLCLYEKGPCGVEVNRHVTVNCSNKEIWPYIPDFPYYAIGRRTWSIDFSNNGITILQSFTFKTENGISMNLTNLDVSHNYIKEIQALTFTGDVSKDLAILDISYNKLTEIKVGTFNDTPALRRLDLSHNRLLSIDPICSAQFIALTDLLLNNNRVSNVQLDCLSSSSQRVSVNLKDNFIASVDDCSYSGRINTLQLEENPIICGCTSKYQSCYKLDETEQGYAISTQDICPTSQCKNVTFGIIYGLIDQNSYNITVQLGNDDLATFMLVNLDGVGANATVTDVTPKLLQSDSQAKSVFKSDNVLEYSANYTVCVTPATDSNSKQRKCQFLTPPYFSVSGATNSVYSIPLGVVLCSFDYYAIFMSCRLFGMSYYSIIIFASIYCIDIDISLLLPIHFLFYVWLKV